VAEMTLLLMLACLRRVMDLHSSVRRARWADAWKLQDRFGELGGRTVGLLGYGEVPKILAPMLEAMGARVQYWSRSRQSADLETVVVTSDILSLHLPLSAQTQRILDPRRMKRGAILVNTARGGLVDELGLLEALRDGHLSAAGLDVFANEPLDRNHPLVGMENVVLSPHLAWLTQETLERSIAAALENVRRLREGRELLHRVV